MRVICIDDSSVFNEPHLFLKYGEIYEATGEGLNPDSEECYELSGVPNSKTKSGIKCSRPLYRKSRFIPVSEIDETTFDRNYLIEK